MVKQRREFEIENGGDDEMRFKAGAGLGDLVLV
jgi:hypothetical protein